MSITIIIIAITVIVSFYAWNKPHIMHKSMFNPYRVNANNEYYRFVTSGFIHADQMHLLFNMFTFYFFGSIVENIYQYYFGTMGLVLFVGFYLLAIIIADLPTYFKHRHNPHYNALGASGGVSAIVFSSIMFFPLNEICLFAILCLPGFILGIIYLLYSYFQGKKMGGNINHDAHFYGAVLGIVFSIVVDPSVVARFFNQIMTFKIF